MNAQEADLQDRIDRLQDIADAVLAILSDGCSTCAEARRNGAYGDDDLVAMPDGHGRWQVICVECGREADPRLPTGKGL